MTAWNAPEVTWSADKAISVARLQQFSDSLYYLFNSRSYGLLRYVSGNKTTTSAPFVAVDATNIKVAVAIASGRAKVQLTCTVAKNDGTISGVVSLGIDVDGTNYPMGEQYAFPISAPFLVSYSTIITGLSVATHTFTPTWGSSLDTMTMYGSANRPITLMVEEM